MWLAGTLFYCAFFFFFFLEPLGPGGKDLLLIPGKNHSLSVG